MITPEEFGRCIRGYRAPLLRFKPPGKQWTAANLTGFDGVLIGFSPVPHPRLVAAGVRGGTYVSGCGEPLLEQIPRFNQGGPDRGAILRLRTIGQHL